MSTNLRSNVLFFHKFRPRFALLPVVGTGSIDVACGLVSASAGSRVMAVKIPRIKGKGRGQTAPLHPFTKATRRRNCGTVRIPPTTVHKYYPRAARDLAKPHAVETRLYMHGLLCLTLNCYT
ncbi:hypothetical protein AVEN_217974-1 [Araneus ventricosus]|uniref:Uncharacterized protein n=1 Tax=Araneus ventricosus TaxID=182803 RepID=A0A4Y2DJ42_ARAVE|nr:hypothetical protein AVEN_217974-1 [Araneus ventricosus]